MIELEGRNLTISVGGNNENATIFIVDEDEGIILHKINLTMDKAIIIARDMLSVVAINNNDDCGG